jgi:hypothetical protein
MTVAKIWAQRVADWRASGKTSVEFAEGKGFTGSGLRYWASRLSAKPARARAAKAKPARSPGRGDAVRQRSKAIRIARVIRSSPGAPPVSVGPEGSIVFDFAGTRVAVSAGFDRAGLRDVLELLGEMGDAAVRRALR